jgi:hypothetical protein
LPHAALDRTAGPALGLQPGRRDPAIAITRACSAQLDGVDHPVAVERKAVCQRFELRTQRQGYRATIAALFTCLAAALYATDPSWNVQNVLMGIAVLVSIAALVVRPLRRTAPASDRTKATHRGA